MFRIFSKSSFRQWPNYFLPPVLLLFCFLLSWKSFLDILFGSDERGRRIWACFHFANEVRTNEPRWGLFVHQMAALVDNLSQSTCTDVSSRSLICLSNFNSSSTYNRSSFQKINLRFQSGLTRHSAFGFTSIKTACGIFA